MAKRGDELSATNGQVALSLSICLLFFGLSSHSMGSSKN